MCVNEMKGGLNSGNVCCSFIQNLLFFQLVSKNIKFKLYKNITSPVFLYGCQSSSLTPREVRKLRVFENRALWKMLLSKRDEVKGSGGNCMKMTFMICIPK